MQQMRIINMRIRYRKPPPGTGDFMKSSLVKSSLMKSSLMKRASFTVEAAFVIPICIFIIIALIYTVFVMHDRACVYMEMGKYAEEVMEDYEDNREKKEEALQELKNRCQKRMFICNIEDMNMEYGIINLIIRSRLTCRMRIFGEYNIENRYYNADYSRIIRGIEIVD